MDTIVAVATPPGFGGVGIVRLSGQKACSIAVQLTHHQALAPREIHYRLFYDEQAECIDKGLLLYFKAPHSFTGEDVVELQCHGSPVVLQKIVSLCVVYGARLARPGEFSERAFLNDKMDLIQAEAVADLIHASSETAARLAMRSLEGVFSKKITQLNEHLIALRLYVEAAIDFPEEEIDFLEDGKIALDLRDIIASLNVFRSEATQGALLREGATLVIAGPPNAGKSTLMNALSGRDVAIVTDIAGTTRDVMREHILLDDIPLHLVDTAGLRESTDIVEKEGIKRAWQALSSADCVLLMMDILDNHSSASLEEHVQAALPSNVPVIRVINKIDVIPVPAQHKENTVYLSVKTGEGLNFLKQMIKNALGFQENEGVFLARQRHLDALNQAHALLMYGLNQLTQHHALELLAEDLRCAHDVLCEITGEFTSDDLLGKIFSSFCIGK